MRDDRTLPDILSTGPLTGTIRVASIPSAHPYVRHLSHPGEPDPVLRLSDWTEPQLPGRTADPGWVRDHPDEFDVMHVHFGLHAAPDSGIDALARELHEHGTPVVVTVHEVDDPHHPDRELQQEQLTSLLHTAAWVIAPTETTSQHLVRRHGHRAEVIPHPHVVPLGEMRRRQRQARPPTDAVDLHGLGSETDVERLGSSRVSVLPCEQGSHRSWVEACRDLGVAVVAPGCDPHDDALVFSYSCRESGRPTSISCAEAIERALAAPRPSPIPWMERYEERCRISARHAAVYRRVVDAA